jgi:hypothetical protein
MKRAKLPEITVEDEPSMAERFQRGLPRASQNPHKPITRKPKDWSASKERTNKAKIG